MVPWAKSRKKNEEEFFFFVKEKVVQRDKEIKEIIMLFVVVIAGFKLLYTKYILYIFFCCNITKSLNLKNWKKNGIVLEEKKQK